MRRTTAKEMERWLARRERWGLTWAELARQSGHAARKLRWWRDRLARTGAADARRGFVAVTVREGGSPAPAVAAALEVTTPSGHRVAVPADFDPAHLRRLLTALADAC